MVKSLIKNTLLGAAAVASASQAKADIIQTLTINDLLQAGGGTYAGQFNIGSQLGAGAPPQVALGGSITVYGISSPVFQSTSSTQYQTTDYYSYQTGGGYTGGSWWSGYYYVPPTYAWHYDVNQTTTVNQTDNQVDTIGVVAGSHSASASDSYNSSSATQSLGSYTTGSYYNGTTTYYQYTQTNDSGYYGPISAILTLQQSELDQLNQNGLLDFLASVTDGQVQINSATLDVLTGAPSLTTGVPELPTWVLMLAGFGGIGFAYGRRRRGAETKTVMV